MKNKPIIAAVLSALMLCSCSESTSGEADFTDSVTASQTEQTETSRTSEITETEKSIETEDTKNSETAKEVSINDIPTILDEPRDRKTPSAIMPENMEFSLDLKDITPETDLFALTNMEKHSIGKTFKMDLDGDGVEEEISVAEEDYENGWRALQVVINGTSYNLDHLFEEFLNKPNEGFTCDIDSSDNYIEFACSHSIATNDYLTSFYRYENGELRYIFTIDYDTPDGNGESEMFFDKMNQSVTGKPIVTDGSGVITAARRLDAQTWLAYSHYAYDSESGEISLVCEPVYPYYYENVDNFAAAKEFSSEYYDIEYRNISNPLLREEIALYKKPDLTSETVTLVPQIIYFTAEYPYPMENPAAYGDGLGEWVYIIAEDGTRGWIFVTDGYYLDETNGGEYLFDVFGGLVLYD